MHPLAQLEFSKRVAKRAQYEAFDISLYGTDVLVRNESHANPENHEYTVSIDDGVPVSCTCPADARFDGACKHRVGVAIRRSLIDTVMCVKHGEPPVAADGGVSSVDTDQESESDIQTPATDSLINDIDQTGDECPECLTDFPCWECYRTGLADFE